MLFEKPNMDRIILWFLIFGPIGMYHATFLDKRDVEFINVYPVYGTRIDSMSEEKRISSGSEEYPDVRGTTKPFLLCYRLMGDGKQLGSQVFRRRIDPTTQASVGRTSRVGIPLGIGIGRGRARAPGAVGGIGAPRGPLVIIHHAPNQVRYQMPTTTPRPNNPGNHVPPRGRTRSPVNRGRG